MMRSPFAPALDRRGFLAVSARSLGLFGLAALCTCDNLDNFDIDVGAKATIPKGTIVDELLSSLSLDAFQSIDLSSELKNQGVTKDDVDSVRMTSLSLQIDGPAGATFDFLKSITFYVEADGAPRAEVARIDVIPPGSTKIALVVDSSVELKPYVVAPTMRLTTEVKGSRPPQETQVSANAGLNVDVAVPGC